MIWTAPGQSCLNKDKRKLSNAKFQTISIEVNYLDTK